MFIVLLLGCTKEQTSRTQPSEQVSESRSSNSIINDIFIITQDGCTFEFAILFTYLGNTSVFWDFGDGNTSTQPAPTYTYTTSGTYTVTATVTNLETGETETVTQTVTVVCTSCELDGEIDINAISNPDCTFRFIADYDGDDVLTYSWDFGDGTTGSGAMINHIYSGTGPYTVTLLATDDSGCEEIVQVTVDCLPDDCIQYWCTSFTGFTPGNGQFSHEVDYIRVEDENGNVVTSSFSSMSIFDSLSDLLIFYTVIRAILISEHGVSPTDLSIVSYQLCNKGGFVTNWPDFVYNGDQVKILEVGSTQNQTSTPFQITGACEF